MKMADLTYVLRLLLKINPQDEHVLKAIAFVERDLAIYDARKGQMRESYDITADFEGWG